MLFCFKLRVTPAPYPASKSGHTLRRCENRKNVCKTFHRCFPSGCLNISWACCDLCLHLWQEASEVCYLLYEEPSPFVSKLAISFTSLFAALSPGYVTDTRYGVQYRAMWKHSQCILSFWWLVIENYILSIIMFSPLYLGLFYTISIACLWHPGKHFRNYFWEKFLIQGFAAPKACYTQGTWSPGVK